MSTAKVPKPRAGTTRAHRFTVNQIRLVAATEQQRRAAVKALSALIVSSADPHHHQSASEQDDGHDRSAETGPAGQKAA